MQFIGQPFFFSKAKHGGADLSLIEPEGRQQLDEAAQPNLAAARQDGIAQ